MATLSEVTIKNCFDLPHFTAKGNRSTKVLFEPLVALKLTQVLQSGLVADAAIPIGCNSLIANCYLLHIWSYLYCL